MCDNNNSKNEKVSSEAPQWIQAKLFEGVLKQVESEFKEIQDFRVVNALAPDNSTKPISFMLKVVLDNEHFRETMRTLNYFAVESGMYRKIIPELEKLYSDVGVEVRFGAKSFALPLEKSYILMENLKLQKFHNVNRLEGLDMIHVRSVLKKLAQWHAASAVRISTKGMYPELYCKGFVKPECYDFLKTIFDSATKTLLGCVKEYTNSDLYYDKVVKIHNQLTEEILSIAVLDPEEFNVLNHGDCWSNNIMFQRDDQSGELLDTLFVDFQLPRVATPAQDLLYFILTSCQYDIKLKEFDNMIHFYHDNLLDSLELLKYSKKIPSLKDIHCMLFKDGIWGYYTAVNAMAVVLCDPCDNASVDIFVGNSVEGANYKRQMYSNPRYRKHIENVLPWLLNRGLLDC